MKNVNNLIAVLGLSMALVSFSAAQAPITIKDGDVSFTLREYSFVRGGTPTSFDADLMVGGQDQLEAIPIFVGAGSESGQHMLYDLIGVDTSNDGKSFRLKYRNTAFWANYNWRYRVDVTFKITDQSLSSGTHDSAKLEISADAWLFGTFGKIPFRLYIMNQPCVGGNHLKMRANATGDRLERQMITARGTAGTLPFMSWKAMQSTDNFVRWEINDLTPLIVKLSSRRDIAILRNGNTPYGLGPYAGAFGYAKYLGPFNTTGRLSTQLELSSTILTGSIFP